MQMTTRASWWRPSAYLPTLFVIALARFVDVGAAIPNTTFDADCRQRDNASLICDYRLLNETAVLAARAHHLDLVMEGQITSLEPLPNAMSRVILFLVDTSDPARAAAVRTSAEDVRRLAQATDADVAFGLASFDSELDVLCPIPCDREALNIASDALLAKGKTTELYRNLIEALKLIATVDATHRHIIIFSDGLAEDLAYHHADVVELARYENVLISGVGYPPSVAQSIALQTLRRLAEETGGAFVQAALPNYALSNESYEKLGALADTRGTVHFDLGELTANGFGGAIELTVVLTAGSEESRIVVPVSLPEIAKPAEVTTPPSSPVAPVPISTPVKPRPASPLALGPNDTWAWFWYGLPAMIFSAILAVALAYAVSARRRREEREDQTIDSNTPHAFFISAYDENQRYKIDHTPWRIGRSRNNELTLDDTSVSRLHAEVRRDALGQFTLQDLESLNGVFVNGEPVKLEHLDEGDRVEIGDVGFTFTFQDEDYARQEPTVLVHTRNPQ